MKAFGDEMVSFWRKKDVRSIFGLTSPSNGVYGWSGAVGTITFKWGNARSLVKRNRIHSIRLLPVSPEGIYDSIQLIIEENNKRYIEVYLISRTWAMKEDNRSWMCFTRWQDISHWKLHFIDCTESVARQHATTNFVYFVFGVGLTRSTSFSIHTLCQTLNYWHSLSHL